MFDFENKNFTVFKFYCSFILNNRIDISLQSKLNNSIIICLSFLIGYTTLYGNFVQKKRFHPLR